MATGALQRRSNQSLLSRSLPFAPQVTQSPAEAWALPRTLSLTLTTEAGRELCGPERIGQTRCWPFWSPDLILASSSYVSSRIPTANLHPNPFHSLEVVPWGCLQPCLSLFSLLLPCLHPDLLASCSLQSQVWLSAGGKCCCRATYLIF